MGILSLSTSALISVSNLHVIIEKVYRKVCDGIYIYVYILWITHNNFLCNLFFTTNIIKWLIFEAILNKRALIPNQVNLELLI